MTRYFVRRDLRNDGILELARIIKAPGSLVAESWQQGRWASNPNALRFLHGDADGDEIAEEEMLAIVRRLR